MSTFPSRRQDVLLRPQVRVACDKEMTLPLLSYDAGHLTTVLQSLKATAVQTCDSVRGWERLAALNYGKVTVCRSAEGSPRPPCVPVRVDCGRYTLLWGPRPVVDDADSDSDDFEMEDYSKCPYTCAQNLLRENARHEVEADVVATPNADFEWWKAGGSLGNPIRDSRWRE